MLDFRPKGKRRSQLPGRSDQWRLMMLVATTAIVMLMMAEARKPQIWRMLGFRGPAAGNAAAGQGAAAKPGAKAEEIDTRLKPKERVALQPGEFIAEARDLKEAVLWSPALATAPAGPRGPRRATVIAPVKAGEPPVSHTLVAREGAQVPLREPGEYLLDPSPAVTRAGLVEDLARTLGGDAAKIDPQIAFLTLDRNVQTPFARTLRVAHSAPWHEKQFAQRLRELGIGAVDIRRRGLAGDVDQIRRRLKLSGKARATVVITRVSDKPWGLICTDA